MLLAAICQAAFYQTVICQATISQANILLTHAQLWDRVAD